MKTKKYAVPFLFMLTAVMIAVPWNVKADETDKKEIECRQDAEQTANLFEDLPDNDELFAGYVNELFFDSYAISAYGDYAESRLEGVDLQAYHVLKERLGKIAAGEAASTKISVSLADLGIAKTEWTASDLGFAHINNETINDAAAALNEQITPNLRNVFRYLLVDCPYELYWFDKNNGGISMNGWEMQYYSTNGSDYILSVNSDLVYNFSVAQEYQDKSAQEPSMTVDQSLIRSAAASAENAKKIVKKYEGYSDHDKLAGYKKEICSLVSYNYDAADEEKDTPYGNPWQLIWVFDDDPATEVVCEGYSKAFQYLCDMSDFFNPNIRCYTVTGVMDGGTGAGPHMWNIVTMDDQKNYIVDVTNCDGTSDEDRLFLVGAFGSTSDAYAVEITGTGYTQTITYEYSGKNQNDMDMAEMYGNILEISASDYEFPYVHSGGFGSDLEWTLDANGILNIKGSGDMPEPNEPTDYTVIPWYEYRGEIKRVVIEEGITSVASWAFLQIQNIKELYLPEGLKSIKNASFALSGIEKLVLPESLESVGMLAFANCNSLVSLEIPASVTDIAPGAFLDCENLATVLISSDNQNYEFSDGILYNKGKTSVQAVLNSKRGIVSIPDTVTEIGMYAFNGCSSITGVVIPNGVTQIGTSAFAGCSSLAEIEIPDTVESIGAEAFKDCPELKDIWFLGECPVFQKDEGLGSAFAGADFTLHYPRECETSWEEIIASGFEGAEAAFLETCPENEHVWSGEYVIDKEAGCTQDGEKSKRCSVCRKIKEKAIIPAGHVWEEDYRTDQAATCQKEGSESIHCRNCDEIKNSRAIPVSAHSLVKTGTGINEHYHCSVCGKDFRDADGTVPFQYTEIKEDKNPPLRDSAIKVKSILLTSDASNKIAAGKKVTLSAAVTPENATNPGIVWESDNTKYAVVNGKGVVTTKKAGKGKTVTITASAADGSGAKATFKIKLMQNAVTKVKIQNAKKTLKAGGTMKLKAAVSVNGKKVNKKVKWISSNPDYAAVNAKGQVKAKKAGKNKSVTITVMSTDGTKKKAKVKIRIN